MIKEILLLGDPKLYQTSEPVRKEELADARDTVSHLHDTLLDYQKKRGFGRAIAAPQIGIFKRIIYMLSNNKATVFINPSLLFTTDNQADVLDDCMSFPCLKVKLKRYQSCVVQYKDFNWQDCTVQFENDMSALIQHEYDHLDGILSTMKAIDNRSFYYYHK